MLTNALSRLSENGKFEIKNKKNKKYVSQNPAPCQCDKQQTRSD